VYLASGDDPVGARLLDHVGRPAGVAGKGEGGREEVRRQATPMSTGAA
jgi:hypothetical protein